MIVPNVNGLLLSKYLFMPLLIEIRQSAVKPLVAELYDEDSLVKPTPLPRWNREYWHCITYIFIKWCECAADFQVGFFIEDHSDMFKYLRYNLLFDALHLFVCLLVCFDWILDFEHP